MFTSVITVAEKAKPISTPKMKFSDFVNFLIPICFLKSHPTPHVLLLLGLKVLRTTIAG
jgi:hypothetical protein